jgi:hypothetical protein
MKHRKPGKSSNGNGFAAHSGRPNGHTAALGSSRAPLPAAAEETPRDVANSRGRVSSSRDVAASDDARETSVAGAAHYGAACSDREAYAEAAPPLPQQASCAGGLPRHPEEKTVQEPNFAGPTETAALEDGPSFVRAVAARVDLVGVSASLVCSKDEKICKAELDRLRQLLFDNQDTTEEPPRIDFGDLLKPPRGPEAQQ